MPHALYVCLHDDDKIACFAMDPDSGGLAMRAELAAAGGPSVAVWRRIASTAGEVR